MKPINSPKIIAIASVSGGGKTTAVANVTEQLPNAKALYFDDYDFQGPDDFLQWLYRGTDYNEWNLEPMLADIRKLLAEPLNFIILDFPFARLHNDSRLYMDFTVFIDTPLDIALSRRIMRDFADSSGNEIRADIEYYAKEGRSAYLQMLADIKPDSDLVVDGSGTREDVTDAILLQLSNRSK